jgi:hypothetical protein
VRKRVEGGVIAFGDIAALARIDRRRGDEGAGEEVGELAVAGQRRKQSGEQRRLAREAREAGVKPTRLVQTVAKLAEVARAAAARDQPPERPADVGQRLELAAKAVAKPGVALEQGDEVEPSLDRRAVEQRRSEIGGEQARARAGHRPVDGGEQGSGPAAARALGQLEALASRRVDRHVIARGAEHRRAEEGQRFPSHLVEVGEQAAGGAEGGPVEGAEAVEGGDLEPFLQAPLGGGAVEPGLAFGDGGTRELFGADQLGGGEAGELGVERVRGDRADLEAAGRDVGRGEAVAVADARHRRQPVRASRIEQSLLGQGAGRDDPDDGAVDHRLVPALPRLGRALDLLGDGDPEAAPDQPGEVGFGGVDRHSAHRDGLAFMLAAGGQSDVEAGRGGPGVVEEKLEEIAHPVEEQAALGLGLQRQILRHHRGRRPAALRLCGHGAKVSA